MTSLMITPAADTQPLLTLSARLALATRLQSANHAGGLAHRTSWLLAPTLEPSITVTPTAVTPADSGARTLSHRLAA